MADLDLSFKKSASETWYGMTASLTPQTTSPAEPTIVPGNVISNGSVFQFSDQFSSLTIRHPSAFLATFSTRDRAAITISIAIYLLSNNLVQPKSPTMLSNHSHFFEALDSVFAEIPGRHLRALLQSRLASVRAAFEALLNISGVLKQEFAFKSLVEIGAGNNWLANPTQGHRYLYHAVCMDLDEVVQQLLESGCRQDEVIRFGSGFPPDTTALVKALERRNLQCVQLLLKFCDVNSQLQSGEYLFVTSFTFFIRKTCHFDETLFGQGIKLFLDVGADINSLLAKETGFYSLESARYTSWEGDRTWSVLDYLFCFHPRLFYEFAPNWSPAQTSQPTRAGILMSLELGLNTLAKYCERLAQNVGWACLCEYLELLVAEQLTGIGPWIKGPRRMVDLKIVGTLVDLGVRMDKVLGRVPFLLADYLLGGRKESDGDCDMSVIRYLLDNRAIVDDRALQEAVRMRNISLLVLLIRNTTNCRQYGPLAAVDAAIANDFEAVKTLLDAGVDVNTDFERSLRRQLGYPFAARHEVASLLCQVVESWDSSFEHLNNMIDFLVQRGAHLRLSATKPRLSDLMESVLRNRGIREDIRSKIVQYIMAAGCDLSDPDVPSARLLEECQCGYLNREQSVDQPEQMEMFESMFRNGALLLPGAPLAAWIVIGGGVKLANEMLCAGVDIDDYCKNGWIVKTALQAAAEKCSEELVILLLQKGADVNAPARGYSESTALQGICRYVPKSPAKKEQQMNIIDLLVSYGAKVNAAPARHSGRTALQWAAQHGNLEVIMLLLSCDPPADVNAPPCQFPGFPEPWSNALDLAAQYGRLDVVKLLLINDARSGCWGGTGYDGAIQAAENGGWLAVADLIRQHATTILTSTVSHTDLSQPQRDWHEYGYDDYSDGYTTFSEDSDEDSDQDSDHTSDQDSDEGSDEEYEDYEDNEGDEDDETMDSTDEQDSVAAVEIQPEAAEQPRPENTVLEPDWASDMEIDSPCNFDIGFGNPFDDAGSIIDLEDAGSNSPMDTTTFDWGFSQ